MTAAGDRPPVDLLGLVEQVIEQLSTMSSADKLMAAEHEVSEVANTLDLYASAISTTVGDSPTAAGLNLLAIRLGAASIAILEDLREREVTVDNPAARLNLSEIIGP